MKVKIIKLKGYKDNQLILNKRVANTTIDINDLEIFKENKYHLYRRRGVLVDYIDAVYKELKENRAVRKDKGTYKINPKEVYKFHIANPDRDLDDLAYKFRVHRYTIKKYIKLFLD